MVTNKIQKWTYDITDTQEKENAKKDDNKLRWDNDVNSVAGTTWQRIAKDRKLWKEMEDANVERHIGPNGNRL